MKLPDAVRPIWRTVQIVKITRGLDAGLKAYILAPFLYELFRLHTNDKNALFYTALLWALFYGLMAVLEIPTGAFSDVFGRAKTVIYSLILSVIYGFTLVMLPLCNSVVLLLVVGTFSRIISAVSFTLFNGSFTAWIIDSLRDADPEFSYERILGRSHAYYSWSMIVGALLGVSAYLAGASFIAFIAGSLISLGCVTYCIGMMGESRQMVFLNLSSISPLKLIKTLVATTQSGFRVCSRVPVLWWILGAYATYNLLLNVVDFLWPVTMGAQFGTGKWSPAWYAMVLGVSLAGAFGAQFLAWAGDSVQKNTGHRMSNSMLRRWLVCSLFLASVPILILGYATDKGWISFPLFASCIMMLEITFGVVSPCVDSLINNYIPAHNAKERATILSMGGTIRGLLVLLLMVPSSGVSGMNSPVGWMIPAGILFLMAFVIGSRIKKYEASDATFLSINSEGA